MLRRIERVHFHGARRSVTSVLLLGDVWLHRAGVAELIARDGRVSVTDSAAHIDEVGPGRHVDVVVVDATTRVACEQIRTVARRLAAGIVAFGVGDEEREVIELAEAGVLGFVGREATLHQLVAVVQDAARGEASFPPRIATALLRRISAPAARPLSPDVASLTVREREIVQIIAEGLTNKEIAARLSIEVATVKNHVHNILEKLQVSRRTDAVARLRLVEPDAGPTRLPRTRIGSRAG